MKTIFRVSLLLYLFISMVKICHAGTNTLKYLAHAFVKIKTSEGKVIYIDPYSASDPDSADVVLITHEDTDHRDLTRVIQKPSCQVIRAANAIQNGVYQTFTIGNILIKAVPSYDTWHSKSNCAGYVIEFDSIKIYHGGDTGPIPEMADLANQNINYSLLPMYIGAAAMTQAVDMIQTRYIIPIHTNWPDISYNYPLVGQFKSPHRLVVLPGETIELTHDTTAHSSKIFRVPQEYPTIQSAINAAQNLDSVIVSEGTYHENIRFNGKEIVVASRYFMTKDWQTVKNTIINGSTAFDKNNASTVQFMIGEDSTAVLDGFTITGGTGTRYLAGINWQEGAGIILSYSSAVIKNNIIMNNTTIPMSGTANGGGGGISSFYGNPNIYNNVVASNSAGYAGGIVLNWSKGKIRIT